MCFATYTIAYPFIVRYSASTQRQTIGYSIEVNQERRTWITVFCCSSPILQREKNDESLRF